MGSPECSSPSLSSSIRDSPSPSPSSRNPSLPSVSSTNNETLFAASMLNLSSSSLSPSARDSVAGTPPLKTSSSTKSSPDSISPANSSISGASTKVWQVKLPITADSGTRLLDNPSSSSPSSKPPSSFIPSSKAEASPVPVSSTKISFYGDGRRVWREKKQASLVPSRVSLQELSALSPFLIKVPSHDETKTRFSHMGSPEFSSPSFSSSIMASSSPAPLLRNPSLPSDSSSNNEMLFAPSLLKLPSSSTSPSVRDSVAGTPPLKTSSSTKPSPDSISPANSSISGPLNKVWQVKLPILVDSGTRFVEKPSSSPSSSKPPSSKSEPSPVPVSSTHISFSGYRMRVWREKKPTSMVPSKGSLQKQPALSPFLIEVLSPDDDSSSETSSPLSSVEPLIGNRRVLPKYEIPRNLEEMIKNDIVPPVLSCPLSPSTYADYFATLLYAEDFYIEKWSNYLLKGVTLELLPKITSTNSRQISVKRKTKKFKNNMLLERDFVAFEVDSVPEKRPYLLSRDFVFLRPLNEIAGPFKGRVFRVVKSTTVLVEFGDDFYSQHSLSKRYDVSFSFNRVCLKRAHQAISASADPSFHRIIFPEQSSAHFSNIINVHENNANAQLMATRILNHKGPLPFLVQGPISVDIRSSLSDVYYKHRDLTTTGIVIQEAILEIYRADPHCRILVCSPKNTTSDVLLRSLLKKIPDSRLFRANAAFRDYKHVPDDIIPASLYEEEEECFACPPLAELLNFNVIISTFMNSFRLCAAGIDTEHFTHIFLVDASLVTEPETIVPLANLAGKNTIILVTGCLNKFPNWVRADIARRHGLKWSYFHRLCSGDDI